MTIFFWLLVGLAIVFLFVCTENEWGGWATFVLLSVLAVINIVFKVPIFNWMLNNPKLLIGAVAGYFMVGTSWSVIKWVFYVHKELDAYYDTKELFLQHHNLDIDKESPIPKEFKEKWADSAYRIRQPQIKEHKMSIYIWIAYWPWSMVWTLINDPIKRLVKWIYRRIESTLQAISDRIWRKTSADF